MCVSFRLRGVVGPSDHSCQFRQAIPLACFYPRVRQPLRRFSPFRVEQQFDWLAVSRKIRLQVGERQVYDFILVGRFRRPFPIPQGCANGFEQESVIKRLA